ncbi:MAG TPA: mechanosensitive ion channel family protein [Verrucomicrobiae bacterium]|nr:mechanosensitive ion channel family protein [Verrucomicrobiae bacterium]
MKLKFETFFRVYLVALLLVLGWSLRAAAASTNSTAGATNDLRSALTNTPATSTVAVDRPDTNLLAYELESPPFIHKLARDWPFLEYPVLGNAFWKYLFSLIYIFLAFYVSKFLDYLTRVWLKKWAAKTKTRLDDLLLDLLNGPIKIISFIIFLRIGLNVFQWPPLVQNFLNKGFTVAVAAIITYTIMKLVDLLMGYWHLRIVADADREFHEQIFPVIRKTLKVFVVAVATLVTLDNIGVNITAAIASLSIGGLAVGLAAQDTLGNLFGAMAVFLDKPFRVGDRIQLDATDGFVESIGLRSTKVRSLDGYLVTIPNKTVGNATLINISRRPTIKTAMNIGVTYDTPAEKVKRAVQLLEEIYRAHPKTADLVLSFNQFADCALNILVVHWWNSTDMKEYLAGMQELNLTIKERFDAEGISFAFPTQTLYVKQDSNWQVATQPRT